MEVAAVGEPAGHLRDAVDAARAFADPPVRDRRGGGCAARGEVHRVDDLLVPGAPAEVAGQRLADLVVVRVGLPLEQVRRRDEQPRRAEAALDRARREERVLQGMQCVRESERLDGADLPAVGLHRGDETRADGLAVEPDRAGAALALLARVLRARQPEIVPQHRQEAVRRPDVDRVARCR